MQQKMKRRPDIFIELGDEEHFHPFVARGAGADHVWSEAGTSSETVVKSRKQTTSCLFA